MSVAPDPFEAALSRVRAPQAIDPFETALATVRTPTPTTPFNPWINQGGPGRTLAEVIASERQSVPQTTVFGDPVSAEGRVFGPGPQGTMPRWQQQLNQVIGLPLLLSQPAAFPTPGVEAPAVQTVVSQLRARFAPVAEAIAARTAVPTPAVLSRAAEPPPLLSMAGQPIERARPLTPAQEAVMGTTQAVTPQEIIAAQAPGETFAQTHQRLIAERLADTAAVSPSEDAAQAALRQVRNTATPNTVLRTLAGEEGAVQIPEAISRPIQNAADLIRETRTDVAVSKSVADDLYSLRTNHLADEIRAKQLVAHATLSPVDAEALYHFDENPNFPLTPAQRVMYDQYIRPLKDDSGRIVETLTGKGLPIAPEYYTPRFVAERGNTIDRILGGDLRTSPSGGSLLTRTTQSLKHREMLGFVDENGDFTVGQIDKNRGVTLYPNGQPTRMGRLDGEYNRTNFEDPATRWKAFTDKTGKDYTITQATTQQIEANTPVRYYKNVLANRLVTWLKLRDAERADTFLETLKGSPGFSNVALKLDSGLPTPANWRSTNMPQFRGYVMEPRVAATLDQFYTKLNRNPDALGSILSTAGQVLRTSIFFNPLIHVPNIGVHWLVNRGITPWASPPAYVRLSQTLARAVNAVVHQNSDYLLALEHGSPLQYAGVANENLYQVLLRKMGTELEQNPSLASRIGQALGHYNPVSLIYNFSRKATWLVNDVATLQATYEEMAHGLPIEQAIMNVGKHIPNYRVPATVTGSESLAKFITNPTFQMFGAYHYGALRSYGEMARSLLTGPIADKAAAADKLAMMGLIGFMLYPFLDTLAQRITGNQYAQVRRAGALTVPYNLYRFARGQMDAVSALQATFTPAIGTKKAIELAFNREAFTGQHIYNPEDLTQAPGQAAKDIGTFALGAVSPVGYAQRIGEGTLTPKDFLANLLGVTTPKTTPANRTLQGMIYDEFPQQKSDIVRLYLAGNQAEAVQRMALFNRKLVLNARQALKDVGGNPDDPQLGQSLSRYFLRPPTQQELLYAYQNTARGLQPIQRLFQRR